MLSRRRIRSQLYYAVTMLFVVIVILALAGFQGVLKFRKLAKNTRARAVELPLAANLSYKISDLRATFYQSSKSSEINTSIHKYYQETGIANANFRWALNKCFVALSTYRSQLQESQISDPRLADVSKELECVAEIEARLNRIAQLSRDENWLYQPGMRASLSDHINEVQEKVVELPKFLQERMDIFAEEARSEYRGWMMVSALFTVCAALIICLLARRFHRRVFEPLEILVEGSRQVAAGNYDHRVVIRTEDEMSELADALNAMTQNFQAIRRDLNRQVQQRTKEVVRSEQMASVGFLAAGVAHEINNPLAAIAWSAESLEMRLHDILHQMPLDEDDAAIEEMKKYLRRIQDEAFRCKGITSSLLDFSRLGDTQKSPTELGELIEGVIEMVTPLSRYRNKDVRFIQTDRVTARVNAQEIKQVVLNLVTNALDSIDAAGQVRIELAQRADQAEIVVEDNGCGMSDEVLEHLFEPFFTRRRDGQGTGLGLSITYRIIEEHGGEILPSSPGPGQGSRFIVTLPLAETSVEHETISIQAA